MFDRRDVIAGLEQARLRTGVEPGHAAAEQFHMQLFLLQIEQIQIGDLECAARGGAQCSAKIDNALVINIKARHREVTLGLFRFFLETDCLAVGVEFDHAVTLRVADLISENAGSSFDGESVPIKIEFSVENIVAENKGHAPYFDEFCADPETLTDSFRFRFVGSFAPKSK